MVPVEPLFVNRARELAEFGVLLESLGEGRRRHLALLGLRRVGKTMLLDEVRRRRADAAELARERGVLTSGLRQVERLERQLASSFDAALSGEP